jgi:hypothetical protein
LPATNAMIIFSQSMSPKKNRFWAGQAGQD